jgi:hypothetical protein
MDDDEDITDPVMFLLNELKSYGKQCTDCGGHVCEECPIPSLSDNNEKMLKLLIGDYE